MRTRLTRLERRADILGHAGRLIAARGLAGTEMEDIRLACGISRGGLYHHFANKRAVLTALVAAEVTLLAEVLGDTSGSPIPALLRAGAAHLGAAPGMLAGVHTTEEKLDYLSALEQAFGAQLLDPLRDRLQGCLRPGADPGHVAELFLTINAHINRREVLGQWTSGDAAGFAATALQALAPFLDRPSELDPIIADLRERASTS